MKKLLKNFVLFTGKYLCQSLFFNEVGFLRGATLSIKGIQHRCFLVNIAKFLRITILKNICEWLLLQITEYKWDRGYR